MKHAVRMRSLLIILPALCLPWGSSAIQHGFVDNGIAADRAGATVLIPDPVQNLGQVSDRKQWQIMFPVQNCGNVRLVLNELDLECGCGDKSKQTMLVAPGTTMEIAVPFDTRFAAGSVENCVSFTTNDPAQPRVTLTVRAFVLASLQPKPVPAEDSDANEFFPP